VLLPHGFLATWSSTIDSCTTEIIYSADFVALERAGGGKLSHYVSVDVVWDKVGHDVESRRDNNLAESWTLRKQW
jgi:hypothetical protein